MHWDSSTSGDSVQNLHAATMERRFILGQIINKQPLRRMAKSIKPTPPNQ